MSFNLPEELASDDLKSVSLTTSEYDLFEAAALELGRDMRFEHLASPEEALRRLILESMRDRRGDPWKAFVATHQRAVVSMNCVFPVLYLNLSEPFDLGTATFLPVGHERVPDTPQLADIDHCGAFVVVPCQGTRGELIAGRARRDAMQALGRLRTGMRAQESYDDRQLKFRLGEGYAFDERLFGWRRDPDAAFAAPLDAEIVSRISRMRIASLGGEPRNDVERKAILALEWIDRAIRTAEPLVRVLYLFFGLEALLGRKGDRQKAMPLAYRRTILGEVMSGGFRAPEEIFYDYEVVRSAAVHGEFAPAVTDSIANSIEFDVILAVEEYLAFASDRGIQKRSKLLTAIEQHDIAPQVLAWLRQRDARWNDYPSQD